MRAIAAASRELPTVLVARRSRERTIDSVANDDVAGAAWRSPTSHRSATSGSRTSTRARGPAPSSATRVRARDAEARSRCNYGVVGGSYTEDGGRRGGPSCYEKSADAAIFAANDLAAIGTLSALAERGIAVPDDISVIGCRTTRSRRRSAHQPHDRGSAPPRDGPRRRSASARAPRGGRETARNVLMPPSLVVRGSTATPRSQLRRRGHAVGHDLPRVEHWIGGRRFAGDPEHLHPLHNPATGADGRSRRGIGSGRRSRRRSRDGGFARLGSDRPRPTDGHPVPLLRARQEQRGRTREDDRARARQGAHRRPRRGSARTRGRSSRAGSLNSSGRILGERIDGRRHLVDPPAAGRRGWYHAVQLPRHGPHVDVSDRDRGRERFHPQAFGEGPLGLDDRR